MYCESYKRGRNVHSPTVEGETSSEWAKRPGAKRQRGKTSCYPTGDRDFGPKNAGPNLPQPEIWEISLNWKYGWYCVS